MGVFIARASYIQYAELLAVGGHAPSDTRTVECCFCFSTTVKSLTFTMDRPLGYSDKLITATSRTCICR